MIKTDYLNITKQITKKINDTEIKEGVNHLLTQLQSESNLLNEKIKAIQNDKRLSDYGRREAIKKASSEFIEKWQNTKENNSFKTKKRAIESAHEAKLDSVIKVDENKGYRYSEIRMRLYSELGNDTLKIREKFLDAASKENLDICAAILDDPFRPLDSQTEAQGREILARKAKITGLENNPKYKDYAIANAIISDSVQNIVDQLNQSLNVKPEASFRFDLGGLKHD